ncbi:MAG: hypothetical protein JEY99_18910 [Spirochaetales bacterium]|nr:hypothetical protein [Spirochaetales bacterium]
MNKKGIILLAVLMMAGGAVFASGQQDVEENDYENDSRGRRPGNMQYDDRGRGDGRFNEDCDCFEDQEEVSMTGTVDFTSAGAILSVDGVDWTLMYPYRAVNFDIADGTEVTVNGWAIVQDDDSDDMRRGRMDFDEDGNYFHIISAEIDGEVYELDFDGPMGRGNDRDRGGRMGGRSGRNSNMGGRRG